MHNISLYSVYSFVFVFLCLQMCSGCDVQDYPGQREQMVKEQIIGRGIKDPRVIKAMEKVPRQDFVPLRLKPYSYKDTALFIADHGQTISTSFLVAYMTEALGLTANDKVLEIGTGSGYQTAILAELAGDVYSIETDAKLVKRAKKKLEALKYNNISVTIGNGYNGLPNEAPFDAIIVNCSPEQIPRILGDQLKDGGRMIIPVGKAGEGQKLMKVTKVGDKVQVQPGMEVKFLPMVWGAEKNNRSK